MENSVNIDSIENKRLLWSLMQENGLFKGIENNKYQEIQTLFESKLNEIKNQNVDSSNLMLLNKRIIGNMVEELKIIRGERETKNYKAEDIHKQRQNEFDKKVKTKQELFDNTINAQKPNNIDFSDKADTPFGSEMDGIIAQTLASRERELEQLTQYSNTNEAKKWIGTNEGASNNIKIGETASLDDVKELNPQSPQKIKKRVTFEDTQPASNAMDFLSKIKTKPDNTEIILNYLEEIKADQKKILDLLSANINNK